ncbi:MAG: DNA polymerase III subunit delta [Phycisphaerales bacterium]
MAKRSGKPVTLPDATHRVVVLHGKEAFLRSEHTSALREKLAEAFGEVDVVRFDGESAQAADVLDECRSFGLMAPHKLVIVEEADKLVGEATRPAFERYAEAPSDGATLVLRTQTWRKGNLDKRIENVGVIVPCDTANEATAIRWCGRRCEKRHGATIEPAAATTLVERVGTDLSRLDGELEKLALGVGQGGTITTRHVGELVGRTREEEVWSIQGELLSGDAERTLEHLRAILDNAPRDAHVPVMWACTDLARKIHAASRAMRSGVSPHQIAQELRLWGPSKDAVLSVAGRLDPTDARGLLDACVAGDRAGKSGLGRPQRTLERLAIRFAGVARA